MSIKATTLYTPNSSVTSANIYAPDIFNRLGSETVIKDSFKALSPTASGIRIPSGYLLWNSYHKLTSPGVWEDKSQNRGFWEQTLYFSVGDTVSFLFWSPLSNSYGSAGLRFGVDTGDVVAQWDDANTNYFSEPCYDIQYIGVQPEFPYPITTTEVPGAPSQPIKTTASPFATAFPQGTSGSNPDAYRIIPMLGLYNRNSITNNWHARLAFGIMRYTCATGTAYKALESINNWEIQTVYPEDEYAPFGSWEIMVGTDFGRSASFAQLQYSMSINTDVTIG